MIFIKIILRNITRQKRRSLLTAMIIVAGYLLLSMALSIAEGSYGFLIATFTKQKIGHIQVQKNGYNENPSIYKTIVNYKDLTTTINNEKSILSYSPRVKGAALAYGKKKSFPAEVTGVDILKEDKTTDLNISLKQPIDLKKLTGKWALIGEKVAKNLEVKTGDNIILISQGKDGSIANDVFIIKGIFRGKQSMNAYSVFIDIVQAQNFYSIPTNEVHSLAFLLDSYKRAQSLTSKLNLNNKNKNITYLSWQQLEPEFYSSMQADKEGNNATIVIVLLIVFLSVLNTILMTTMERQREYALLRAIGSSPAALIFFISGEIFFLTLFSLAFALTLCAPIHYWLIEYGFVFSIPFEIGGMMFNRLTGEISFFTIIFPVLIIMLAAITASIWPIVKTLKTQPVEALRNI
jgi:putative ABC transport system permease protein